MKRFATISARLVFVFCVVMAAPAWALGDAPTSMANGLPCANLTPSSEKFIDMLHSIVMHGDLTDVPFVEKALDEKLKVQYREGETNGHHYKNAEYNYERKSKTLRYMNLWLEIERVAQDGFKKTARLRFSSLEVDCKGITPAMLKEKFQKDFMEVHYGLGLGAGNAVMASAGFDGKDGSRISISYTRTSTHPNVNDIQILQTWK